MLLLVTVFYDNVKIWCSHKDKSYNNFLGMLMKKQKSLWREYLIYGKKEVSTVKTQ
jgi:hypothetical protein